MTIKRTNQPGQSLTRRGIAAVEAAIVLPLLIIVTFCAIDLAQYINLAQMVANASREGARIASRNSTGTVKEVEDTMKAYMSSAIPSLTDQQLASAVNIEIKSLDDHGKHPKTISGGTLSSIDSGDPISVYVEFDFAVIRWMGSLSYWDGDVRNSRTVCRRE